ncbi:MAG: Azurin [Phycisphaerales bacterium]|nr:Azurin [Phycisphaerales bacterium]
MKLWNVLATVAPMTLAGILLVGCGQGDSADKGAAAKTPAAQKTTSSAKAESNLTIPAAMQAFKDDGNVLELEIDGTDMMTYNIDHLEAKPGQMIRLTLKHVGKLPAASMGHNVVILKAGEDVFAFAADAGEKGGDTANAYVPEGVRSRVIAFTKIVGGGKKTTVEFQAPETAGEYPFLCSFPGHVGNMNGKLEVK